MSVPEYNVRYSLRAGTNEEQSVCELTGLWVVTYDPRGRNPPSGLTDTRSAGPLGGESEFLVVPCLFKGEHS